MKVKLIELVLQNPNSFKDLFQAIKENIIGPDNEIFVNIGSKNGYTMKIGMHDGEVWALIIDPNGNRVEFRELYSSETPIDMIKDADFFEFDDPPSHNEPDVNQKSRFYYSDCMTQIREMNEIYSQITRGLNIPISSSKWFKIMDAIQWTAVNEIDLGMLKNADGEYNYDISQSELLGIVERYHTKFKFLRYRFNSMTCDTDTSFLEIKKVIETLNDVQRRSLIESLHSALTRLSSSGDIITKDNYIDSLLYDIYFGRQGGSGDLRPGYPESDFDFEIGDNDIHEIKSTAITVRNYELFEKQFFNKLWHYCRVDSNCMEKKIERNPEVINLNYDLEFVMILSYDNTEFQNQIIEKQENYDYDYILEQLRTDKQLYKNAILQFNIRIIFYDGTTFLFTKEKVNDHS